MFNIKVVKEDMFKYSTTKLGKAMEKVDDSVNTMTLACMIIDHWSIFMFLESRGS